MGGIPEAAGRGAHGLRTTQSLTDAEHCDRVALLVHGTLVALDAPQAPRQQVFGGDVLEILTRGSADPRVLFDVPGVLDVRRSAPGHFVVVADDAGRATPRITDALAAAGGRVVSAEKYEPTFDDVFVALVERSGLNGLTEARS